MTLPYELIGKITVGILAIAVALIILGIVLLGVLITWNRVFSTISQVLYPESDRQYGVWRTRCAGIAAALAYFQFRKIPAVYQEAEEIAQSRNE